MPRWASQRNWLSSTVPSSSMSTMSVQYEDGVDALTDVAPLPTLDFWLWFFAAALGPGEFAFAATVGPTFTLGAVPVVVCDCATLRVSKPTPAISPPNNIDFFMSCLLRNFPSF